MLSSVFRGHVGWAGFVGVSVYRDGQLVDRTEMRNLITDTGLNLLRDALHGDVDDAQIKYVAWGDSATGPAASDSALGNEEGRRQITRRSIFGGTGVLQTTAIISSIEGNDQIEELGFFAGTAATAVAGSGVLVARVLYSHLKTDLESIQVDRTDTLAR